MPTITEFKTLHEIQYPDLPGLADRVIAEHLLEQVYLLNGLPFKRHGMLNWTIIYSSQLDAFTTEIVLAANVVITAMMQGLLTQDECRLVISWLKEQLTGVDVVHD